MQLFKCSLSKEGFFFSHGMKKENNFDFPRWCLFQRKHRLWEKTSDSNKNLLFFSPKIGNICSINYFLIYSEQTSFTEEKYFEPRNFVPCCYCHMPWSLVKSFSSFLKPLLGNEWWLYQCTDFILGIPCRHYINQATVLNWLCSSHFNNNKMVK